MEDKHKHTKMHSARVRYLAVRVNENVLLSSQMAERQTRDRGRGFESHPLHCFVWPKASSSRTPASVTKQY